MASLYELKSEYVQILGFMEDEDVEQVYLDTLEGVKGEIEVKAEDYCYVIRQAEADLEMIKKEEEFFKAKRERLEGNIKKMKEAIKEALILTGHDDKAGLKAGPFTLKVAGNGGKQPLKVVGDVPDNMTKVTVAPDNDKIREYLKDNTCDWAYLEERGTHLIIK